MPAPGVPQTRSTLSVARDGTIRVGIGNESIAIPDIA